MCKSNPWEDHLKEHRLLSVLELKGGWKAVRRQAHSAYGKAQSVRELASFRYKEYTPKVSGRGVETVCLVASQ